MRLGVALACLGLVACHGETFASSGADAGPASDAAALGDAGGARAARYAATVLADGPIGYWRLEETTSPAVAADEAGGRSGVVAPAVTLGADGALGAGDRAMTFHGGTDENVKIVDEHPFDFTGNAPFTVEAWFKCTTPQNVGRLASKFSTTANLGWSLAAENNGTLEFDRFPAIGVTDGVHSVPIADGAWHYVVATYDGATLTLYGDQAAAADARPATEAAASSSPAPLTLGTGSGGGAPYVGSLDEVAIYARALPKERVAAHWAAATSD